MRSLRRFLFLTKDLKRTVEQFQNKVILKNCGTTTIYLAIEFIQLRWMLEMHNDCAAINSGLLAAGHVAMTNSRIVSVFRITKWIIQVSHKFGYSEENILKRYAYRCLNNNYKYKHNAVKLTMCCTWCAIEKSNENFARRFVIARTRKPSKEKQVARSRIG